MITALISDLWPWAVGAVLAVLGLIGYGKVKKNEGRNIERNKRIADRLKAVQKKNEIEKDISNADRDSVIDANTRD